MDLVLWQKKYFTGPVNTILIFILLKYLSYQLDSFSEDYRQTYVTEQFWHLFYTTETQYEGQIYNTGSKTVLGKLHVPKKK
jgi:hypothetical protein